MEIYNYNKMADLLNQPIQHPRFDSPLFNETFPLRSAPGAAGYSVFERGFIYDYLFQVHL